MKQILYILVFVSFISCIYGDDKNSNSNVKSNESKTQSTLQLNRPTYSLEYLSDWTIDSSSELFNIDNYFTLHSPVESGLIVFVIFNIPKDENESLQDHINIHLEGSMKNGIVTYFNKWGTYEGHGAIIKDRISGLWKSEVKIFVHSTTSNSFVITSIYADNYKDDVLPGLNQIESSFKLK